MQAHGACVRGRACVKLCARAAVPNEQCKLDALTEDMGISLPSHWTREGQCYRGGCAEPVQCMKEHLQTSAGTFCSRTREAHSAATLSLQ
eukprot:1155075-Pelagomonas_calceolata.AAC.3